jgi:hypothetical protein
MYGWLALCLAACLTVSMTALCLYGWLHLFLAAWLYDSMCGSIAGSVAGDCVMYVWLSVPTYSSNSGWPAVWLLGWLASWLFGSLCGSLHIWFLD